MIDVGAFIVGNFSLFPIEQVAAIWHVEEQVVIDLIGMGELKALNLLGNIRVPAHELARYIKENTIVVESFSDDTDGIFIVQKGESGV